MTDLDPTPKPCPFCGSDTIEPRSMPLVTIILHCYQCQTCGGTGGSSNTRLTALAIWNRRAEKTPGLPHIPSMAELITGRKL